jgi:hypothetical protein
VEDTSNAGHILVVVENADERIFLRYAELLRRIINVKVKVNQSNYRPRQALRFPGG